MPKLKAATVSNSMVKKRKRSNVESADCIGVTPPLDLASEPGPSTVPTKTHDGGSKPRRILKTGKLPTLNSKASSFPTSVTTTVPWPASFQLLEKTQKALNLVFTFCSTRKHLATTFDNLKSAVEGHIKRNLSIEDVAKIVALRPGGMNFVYVDEAMLQVDVRGSERDDTFKGGRSKTWHAAGPPPDSSVGGITGMEGLGHGDDLTGTGKEVLFFEFVDGDLKRQVQDKKTGDTIKPTRKLRDEDLKMPVYSQKQLMNLIEKRNTKFTNAINAFLNRCHSENLDPEETLKTESEAFIPEPSCSRGT